MTKYLFNEEISDWKSWGKVYQSIPAFEKLAKEIMKREGLPFSYLERLTPGTNAVFKIGEHVIKIFAPKETGMDQTSDEATERFAIKFAGSLGVNVPKIVACGMIKDRYTFSYTVMKYINGYEIGKALNGSDGEKLFTLGKKLRVITDKMNISCQNFNGIDVINDPDRSRRWETFPLSFQKERQEYIKKHDYGKPVFTHGDLCADNVFLTNQNVLFIIDFADAVAAPDCYEGALIAFEYRDYPDFLRGYFSKDDKELALSSVFDGILIHDFGGDIVKKAIGNTASLQKLDDLRHFIMKNII